MRSVSGASVTSRRRRGKKSAELDGATLSGWPLNPKERGDFLHRPRAFPSDVMVWRKELIRRVRSEPALFAAIAPDLPEADVRSLVDDGIAELREIARILSLLYRNPRLGNPHDPVDELVYIILSRKTRESAYQQAYSGLKKAFPTWDALLKSSRRRVEQLVRSGGLSSKKTESLFGALQGLEQEFGRCTLAPTSEWSNERLEAFLCSLPEIQKKSAYCIMMYSLGRKVFPVDTHVGRILSRIGIFHGLGLDLEGRDHKQLQRILADLVPPNLRYSLHVNLVQHGREVCRARNPLCGRCELSRFCRFHRRAEAARVEEANDPTFVDLFSGAGGLSAGFTKAGFRCLMTLDSDPVALKTYRVNHPELSDDRILCEDIRSLELRDVRRLVGRRKLDVLIGAPPCQGFSLAGFRSRLLRSGYRTVSDSRNFLYEFMVAIALHLKPRLFLMENVPGMSSAKRSDLSFIQSAARMLEDEGGYRTATWKLNAAAFGVPQDRVRFFLVASRCKLMPVRPPEEYQDHQRGFDVDALEPVTLDEAIFDLPLRGPDEGTGVSRRGEDDVEGAVRTRRYLSKFSILSDAPLLYNHSVRYHNERDLELYDLLEPGEDSVHALERHGRHDLMRYRADVFDDKYGKLRGDRPCRTIVAHLAKDGNGYIHPRQTRSISIREGARVQSFPDDFVFCGTPSDQWRQLGNAVPPVLSGAIARSLKQVLDREKRR